MSSLKRGALVEPGPFLADVLPEFTRTQELLAAIHAELVSSRGSVLAGAEARSILNAGPSGGKVSSSAGTLAGYSIRETSGAAAAVVQLWDSGTNGNLIYTVRLAASESTSDWFMPLGIGFVHGLSVVIVSGAVEGAIYLAPPP